MNEAPPVPVSDSFNVSQWNATDTGKTTQSWVSRNFLSKVIVDSASKLISFSSGIKTNLITVYSENILTIGEGGGGTKTVSLYYPYLAVAILDAADNTERIPSTSWVQLWFGNIINTLSLTWALAQTFTLGILTNSIKCITTSGTLNINSVDSATGGVIICGGPSQTSGVTIGNNNGITTNKIDIGSQTKTLSLTGSNIDLATALRPFYSYTSSGTGSGRIGEIITGSYIGGSSVSFTSGASRTYSLISLTAEGIYTIYFQGTINANGNITFFRSYVETDSNVKHGAISTYLGTFNGFTYVTNSLYATVYHTGTKNYNARIALEFAGVQPTTTNVDFQFLITRIA